MTPTLTHAHLATIEAQFRPRAGKGLKMKTAKRRTE